MKVLKVKKSFRGGETEKLILVSADFCEDEYWEEEFAREWADKDPGGANYGYRLDWGIVEDSEIIKKCLLEEKELAENKILWANKALSEIKGYLNKYE